MTKTLFGWGFVSGMAFALAIGVHQTPQNEAAPAAFARAGTSATFEYFPAQFVNQGAETGEHIATF